MTLEQATKILRDNNAIKPDGSLHSLGWYLSWHKGSESGTLDGNFMLEQLEAIVVYMRAHLEE